METQTIITYAIIILAVVIVIWLINKIIRWFIYYYNSFIVWKQSIQLHWSNIIAEYQRRADLFYNLAQAVKSYFEFENKSLTSVIKARGGNLGTTKEEQIENIKEVDNSIASILPKLIALKEQYPNLKSIQQFNNLTEELKVTENRINEKRIEYNNVVLSYNIMVKQFPGLIAAKFFRFKEEEYYSNKEGKPEEKEYKILEEKKNDN